MDKLTEQTLRCLESRYGATRERNYVRCIETGLVYTVSLTADRTAVCIRVTGTVEVIPVIGFDSISGGLVRKRLETTDCKLLNRRYRVLPNPVASVSGLYHMGLRLKGMDNYGLFLEGYGIVKRKLGRASEGFELTVWELWVSRAEEYDLP